MPLARIKELRKETDKFIMQSPYTKDRVCFSYELSKKGNRDIERYHLFNKYTLKHLESYDTTRYYNSGSIGGFGCLTEDTTKTKQNKVLEDNDIDKKIFKLVSEYK